MSQSALRYVSIEDWISQEAVSFSLDSSKTLDAAVDRMMAEAEAVEADQPLMAADLLTVLASALDEEFAGRARIKR